MSEDFVEKKFKITIKSSPETLWQSITNPQFFAKWACAFSQGATVEGLWLAGETLRFTDADGNGLISKVEAVVPSQMIALRCVGTVVEGSHTVSEVSDQPWLGAGEQYRVTRTPDGCELKVKVDIAHAHQEYFDKAWPQALRLLKQVTEAIAQRMTFINLPVQNLTRSIEFFSTLGFVFNPLWTDETATCIILGERTFAMLVTKEKFKTFTPKNIADSHACSEVLVALSCTSRKEVNDLVARAVAAGGKIYNQPTDYGFMYSHGFEDLDGHIWELAYMNMADLP